MCHWFASDRIVFLLLASFLSLKKRYFARSVYSFSLRILFFELLKKYYFMRPVVTMLSVVLKDLFDKQRERYFGNAIMNNTIDFNSSDLT